jgi:hypothetical protein
LPLTNDELADLDMEMYNGAQDDHYESIMIVQNSHGFEEYLLLGYDAV